ncbi:MAG: serine protease, partial [Pseudomonadota bacterium]
GVSVGLVSAKLGTGMGTCFVVAGEDFHPSLAGERLVLTNDHVVSPRPEDYTSAPPLRVEKAVVSFEVFSKDRGTCEIAAREVVWSSGAQDHDACLIRLAEDPPEDLRPLPIGRFVPLVDAHAPEGVYVIGHPGGRSLSYSMQNNELLDHDCKPPQADGTPRRIHYMTPTEPGSSGSPAMNAELDVIGLHHAGAKYMSKLNGKEGTYPANEAVWIQSICTAAREDLDAGRARYAR